MNIPLPLAETISILKLKVLSFLLLLAAIGFFGCNTTPSTKKVAEGTRIKNSYARGFVLLETEDGFNLQIRNPRDTLEILENYTFSKSKNSIAGKNVIKIPVQSVAVYSTTFLPYFKLLGKADLVTGIANAPLVMDKEYLDNLENGKAIDISDNNEPNLEKLITLQNDVFMVYPYANNDFSRYKEVGIPVLYNVEHQEEHPLARVEWIKVAGALTGKLEEATEISQRIIEEYKDLILSDTVDRPTVFTGSYYGGIWYAPPANSYLAHLIQDAGGKYLFDEKKQSGNISLDFESAFDLFDDADFWGIVISAEGTFSREDVLAMNSRYNYLKSFQQGQIFYCNTRISDYFGAAVMEPQVILTDMISIFYPERYPSYQQVYFKQIDQSTIAK